MALDDPEALDSILAVSKAPRSIVLTASLLVAETCWNPVDSIKR